MLQITKSVIKTLRLQKLALKIMHIYAKLSPNQIIKRDGINYRVDLSKVIDYGIFLGGWEPYTIQFLKSYLKQGHHVLEVGANIGAHSLLIAKLIGEKGQLIAIEPTKFALNKLTHNISLNKDLSNITVVDKIVSDTVYKGNDIFNSDWNMNSSQSPQNIEFVSTTLDLIVQKAALQRVDLIKIDVDGYDYKALRGAKNIIEKYKPTIFVELCEYAVNEQGDSVVDIFTYLESFGYECFSEIDGQKINAEEVMSKIGLTTSMNGIFKSK